MNHAIAKGNNLRRIIHQVTETWVKMLSLRQRFAYDFELPFDGGAQHRVLQVVGKFFSLRKSKDVFSSPAYVP